MSTAFRVLMTGGQQVPPTASAASGLGTVVFDSNAVAASYSINVRGLDFRLATNLPSQTPSTADDVAGFHVHNAPRGANGPIVFGQIDPAQDNDDLRIVLNPDASWTVSGVWDLSDPPSTSTSNNPYFPSTSITIGTFANELNAAPVGSDVNLYFNAHTPTFPNGLIRGQWVAIANDDSNVVVGTARADSLPGLGGNDVLKGLRGNDVLSGGSGDDRLFGGLGADVLAGGTGNDRLNGGLGDDHLAGGRGSDRLNGNLGDDVLSGGRGNDILNGGFGSDVLTGGAGRDAFVFGAPPSFGVDTIVDFHHGIDSLRLSHFAFTGLTPGALPASAFHVGTAAASVTERIVYDDATGALFFDPDGSGALPQVQFATLVSAPKDVASTDFFIV